MPQSNSGSSHSVTFSDMGYNMGIDNPVPVVNTNPRPVNPVVEEMTKLDTSWARDFGEKGGPDNTSTKRLDNGHNLSDSEVGCLVLGEEPRRGNRYVTRYRIDHSGQRRDMCADIMREELCTCTLEEKRRSCGRFVLAFFGSEAFLVTLHMSVIVIGVMKEARNLRDIDKDLHLIHSILETIAAMLQAFLRIFVIWSALKESEKAATKLEHNARQAAKEKGLRKVIIIYTIISAFLIVGGISAFLAFYFLDHLEWSLLSNSFVTVVAMLMGNMLNTRIMKAQQLIIEDQHKVLIFESNLLLHETQDAMKVNDPKTQKHLQDRIGLYLRAVRDTEEFEKPDHIHRRGNNMNESLNAMTTVFMQSTL